MVFISVQFSKQRFFQWIFQAGELGTLWLTQFNEARSQSGISGLISQTYLPCSFCYFPGYGNRLSQEPACRISWLLLLFYFILDQTGTIARFFQQEPSLDSFHRNNRSIFPVLHGCRNLDFTFCQNWVSNWFSQVCETYLHLFGADIWSLWGTWTSTAWVLSISC